MEHWLDWQARTWAGRVLVPRSELAQVARHLRQKRSDSAVQQLRKRSQPAKGPELVARGMDNAESCNVLGRPGPNDYSYSQLVADLVRGAGFDGMLVPGVRGTGGAYRNLVIFEPRCWRDWSRKAEGFRQIGPTSTSATN